MIKQIITLSFCLFHIQFALSQVGIGTTHPDPSSVLEVSSSEKGFLAPRMTTAQRDGIILPAEGLLIYNTQEKCLQLNTGSPSVPDWNCIGEVPVAPTLVQDCSSSSFLGYYNDNVALSASNIFEITIQNNSSNPLNINFTTGDLMLSGIAGVAVSSVSPTTVNLSAGASQTVEYSLTGTPNSTGDLLGIWTKLDLSCQKTVHVYGNGDANFTLPQTIPIVSVYDGTPLVDLQGIVDNSTNQITVKVPYTNGFGVYDAYSGTYVVNNSGTGEVGDVNSFRLTYPSGAFNSSGYIEATIEVDGDGSFNAKKLLFGVQEALVSLDFKVNGISKGDVNLEIVGGIPDRNFADPEHKFIYIPMVAADGSTWLSNNLGANYANMNHPAFNPSQQATAYNDFNAYGSKFQWGRYSDGHELINYSDSITAVAVYGITDTLSATDTPGHSMFIKNNNSPNDWRLTYNFNLWQTESSPNNPCPVGYRVPTVADFESLEVAEGITNYNSALNNGILRLTKPGARITSGGIVLVGSGPSSFLWTKEIDPLNDFYVQVRNYYDTLHPLPGSGLAGRVQAYPVRCIKD